MAKSALEQVKELEEKKQAILGKAKEEALAKVKDGIKELHNLGFNNYQLSSGSGSTGSKGSVADEACDICGFKTSPPHDGRKHRSQGNNKKRFTDAELRGMNLTKVG